MISKASSDTAAKLFFDCLYSEGEALDNLVSWNTIFITRQRLIKGLNNSAQYLWKGAECFAPLKESIIKCYLNTTRLIG
jgi:hypothetical protein